MHSVMSYETPEGARYTADPSDVARMELKGWVELGPFAGEFAGAVPLTVDEAAAVNAEAANRVAELVAAHPEPVPPPVEQAPEETETADEEPVSEPPKRKTTRKTS